MLSADQWRDRIEREIDVLTRAPFFVQEPRALIEVRGEIRRLRTGRGSLDDGSNPIIDNARAIQATLDEAARELTTVEIEELELFLDERLVESRFATDKRASATRCHASAQASRGADRRNARKSSRGGGCHQCPS